MKTTIEIPDPLFHQAKITSAQRGITMKQLFIEGLEHTLQQKPSTKTVELTEEQSKLYSLDEFGVPVLRKKEGIDSADYLSRIDQIREEMGI